MRQEIKRVTLNDSRNVVLQHTLNIAGEVLNVKDEVWFDNLVKTSIKDDWYLHEKLNTDWVNCEQTVEDESKLYSSNEYAFDICKCYTHWTKPNVAMTVRGILDIRKEIPDFADGWTFVDYFGGVALSSIYLAQQLTAAGINANVVYYNSGNNIAQVALAKRFFEEFGSPSNMSFHISDEPPKGDCYLFYEVFEHIREPWEFVKYVVNKNLPKCILHVSRFNLPLISGHFKNYTIDGQIFSGKIATREFEKRFKTIDFVRTVIPQEFNGVPRMHIHKSVFPSHINTPNMKWDMKSLKKKREMNSVT